LNEYPFNRKSPVVNIISIPLKNRMGMSEIFERVNRNYVSK
jgi:hypothetical protein